MKNITITGPRSVGKSTVSKIVAKKLKLKYISSDELGEKIFKKYGGLDGAIKSGKIRKIIDGGGYSIILNIYNNKKNFVFDLSGGSFTSRSMAKASEEVRNIAKKKSFVVGLLPGKYILTSSIFLFKRETKRVHFKDANKIKLFWRTFRKYPYFKKMINKHANMVVYTRGKSPDEISDEIVKSVLNK